MNGRELLEAMGHVEERYVDEAEYKMPRKSIPLGWISAAACLCILIGGAMLWIQPQVTNDSTAMENNGGGNMAMESDVAETAGTMKVTDGAVLTEDPCVHVRILAWTEDGFTGLVECEPYSNTFADGTELTVRFGEKTSVMIYVDEATHRWEDRMPTEMDFPVGTLVCVQFQTILEDGAIFAAVIDAVEEGEE